MERHVPLEGCLNLRDIGGYPTVDGREVRRRCLFRSDELCALTEGDVRVLGDLGIRVVFDLRTEAERSARPSRLPPGVQVFERSSPAGTAGPGLTLEEQIAAGELPVRDDEFFAGVYIDLLDRLAPEMRQVLELAVDAPRRPVLFHCAAGKDRTGLVAAVLLGLLGVPDETVVEDYELTSAYYAPRRLEALAGLLTEHGVAPEQVAHLVAVRAPVLETALRHLHDRWGGYDGYAVDGAGVDPGLPDRLRSVLTV